MPVEIFDDDDVKDLALMGWKEARGEGLEGVRAVMHVANNRVGSSGFPHTLYGVIYGKNQFSSMSIQTDPQYHLSPPFGDGLWSACCRLSQAILAKQDADITLGARYYANIATATSGWFFTHISGPDGLGVGEHKLIVKIGKHNFYL